MLFELSELKLRGLDCIFEKVSVSGSSIRTPFVVPIQMEPFLSFIRQVIVSETIPTDPCVSVVNFFIEKSCFLILLSPMKLAAQIYPESSSIMSIISE